MKTAYLVDDNEFYHKMLEAHFRQMGYAVRSFFTVKECYDNLRDNPYVILLDENLGDGERGTDYIQKLKKKAPHIPIVLLSGNDDSYTVAKALKLGAFDYIEKNNAALVRLRAVMDSIPAFRKSRNQAKWIKIAIGAITLALLVSLAFVL